MSLFPFHHHYHFEVIYHLENSVGFLVCPVSSSTFIKSISYINFSKMQIGVHLSPLYILWWSVYPAPTSWSDGSSFNRKPFHVSDAASSPSYTLLASGHNDLVSEWASQGQVEISYISVGGAMVSFLLGFCVLFHFSRRDSLQK